MAVGPPSTGKMLSLQAALSLFGADNCSNQYNTCTKAYCLQKSAASTVPFEIDDSSFCGDINDIIVSFFNGTISANIAQGSIQPISCPIFCTNFSIGNNERHSSRVVTITFVPPRIGPTDDTSFKESQCLQDKIKQASRMAGAIVSLEQNFIKDQGTKLGVINQKIMKYLGYTRSRVSTGYALVLYFTEQLLLKGITENCVEIMMARIWENFEERISPLIEDDDNAAASHITVTID